MRQLFAVLLVFGAASSLWADPQPPLPDGLPVSPDQSAPPAVRVVEGPFKVTVTVSGIFVPVVVAEKSLQPREWSEFVVAKAIAHGSQVQEGQELVRFDREKLDQQIADLEADLKLEELSLTGARDEIAYLEKANKLSLATAERLCALAGEDLDRFRRIFRPSAERWAKFTVKDLEDYLGYETDELKQLEKMYAEDQVTEETEEIVLKRQRDYVAKIKFYLAEAVTKSGEELKTDLPRLEKSLADQAAGTELALEKLKLDLPAQLKARQLQLRKQELKHRQQQERLAQLQADALLMTITAPQAGTVYYGQFENGKWNIGEVERVLAPGGRARPHQVLLSIVQQRPLRLAVSIPEADLELLKPGAAAVVTAASEPLRRLAGTLETISPVPNAPGSFSAVLKVELPANAERLVAGLAGKAEFVPYVKPKTLVVPSACVFTDELDSERRYVWRWQEAPKKALRQGVKIGRVGGERTEILDGLSAGEKILTSPPKDDP